ncbi:MAG: hypothetical protein IPG80_19530 [Anaerolineales bacterium]|uniref:hypothetical protein n=1 Tax=Candidatus Villigracilis vicinus TaxID=3140679 RepID=UPI0031365C72|nr:hypothetical protein [Anaerolineales bacterium]
MKQLIWTGLLIFVIGTCIIGCGPATMASSSFAGTWTTNLGTVNFIQNGDKLTGNIAGYGGFWNETFSGSINENGEAFFETEVLGSFTLVAEGENNFKSTSTELSFCGVRGENMELPAGCGFSGKWNSRSELREDEGYLLLTQTGETVTGDLYNIMGEKYETFTGTVEWGKGWRANGTTKQRGNLSLWINSSETGFELMYGDSGNPQKLCAVRDGLASAYLFSYTCES